MNKCDSSLFLRPSLFLFLPHSQSLLTINNNNRNWFVSSSEILPRIVLRSIGSSDLFVFSNVSWPRLKNKTHIYNQSSCFHHFLWSISQSSAINHIRSNVEFTPRTDWTGFHCKFILNMSPTRVINHLWGHIVSHRQYLGVTVAKCGWTAAEGNKPIYRKHWE